MRLHPRLRSSWSGAALLAPIMFACGLLAFAVWRNSATSPWLLLNTTGSLPKGLYRRIDGPPKLGALAAFRLPSHTTAVPPQKLFLKPVAASGGHQVCSHHRTIYVDGRPLATALLKDSAGHLLQEWRGCRRLSKDELLMISTYSPRSFDSRYFGPIPAATVIASYTPAMTFQGPRQ